jgi:hypothetical protein
VHLDDGVELLFTHVVEHPVPQDARVVDQNVELAERIQRRGDHRFGCVHGPDRRIVECRGHTESDRLVGYGFGRGGIDIVDDDIRTFGSEGQDDGAADASAGAGDHAGLSLESVCHERHLRLGRWTRPRNCS